jgi:hypothetical protein
VIHYGNIVLLTIGFVDVAEVTTPTSWSLLISCKLSYTVIGLKTFSSPIFALKSTKFSCGTQGIDQKHVLIRHRISASYHHFCPPWDTGSHKLIRITQRLFSILTCMECDYRRGLEC